MNRKSGIYLLLLCFCAATAWGQEPQPPADDAKSIEAAHDQLRKLKTDVETAVNEAKWESLTKLLSDKVIVIWLDGTQSHGPEAVLKYMKTMTEGDSPIVDEFKVSVDATELSDFHGATTATAYGMATCEFVLRGRSFSASGPWSAAVVREGDAWKLALVHASVGLFDNPLLTWAWRCVWIAAVIGFLLGGLLLWLIGRRRRKASLPAT